MSAVACVRRNKSRRKLGERVFSVSGPEAWNRVLGLDFEIKFLTLALMSSMVHYDLRTRTVKQIFLDRSVFSKQRSVKFEFQTFFNIRLS